MLCAVISLVVIIPFSLIAFPKGSRLLPCSSLMIVVFLNNVVACSLPAIGGLYGDVNVEKYAYLQILAGSGITYAPVYFCFELDATLRKMSGRAVSRGQICTIVKQALLKVFTNPLILGVLTGIIMNFIMTAADATYPKFLVLMFDMVGNPMTPIGLLILGIFIYTQIAHRKDNVTPVVVSTSTRVHVAM